MCVVTLVETVRPTDAQVGQMWDQNPKGGGGVAYRAVEDGTKVVKWKKGLSIGEQREGCPSHLTHPDIVPGKQIDAGDGWISYEMRDKSIFVDGVKA